VLVATLLAVTAVLSGQSDSDLRAIATALAKDIREAEHHGQLREWLSSEFDEHRPPDVRAEVYDERGAMIAASGSGPAFSNASAGCDDHASFRACGARADGFLILAGRSRQPGIDALKRFAGALILAVALGALLMLVIARRITRKALAPVSALAERVAVVEPGAGMRIGLGTDLEELRRLEDKFDALIGRFDEALARERRFAAEASHELRTPLTVLRAEVEALADISPDPEAGLRALAATDGLLRLVEALLWFSRAQGRLDDERMEIVNLADLARVQAEELRTRYPAANLSVRAPDEALVRGDEHLLARAAANLMENAIKYGAQRPVLVELSPHASHAQLHVTDGGPGIPDSARHRIFEPFFRGGRERAETPGFGLGLPLARAVARAHGGDVRIHRSDAHGTAFILELPTVASPSQASDTTGGG
jgi:signal transduction histidine kinase